MPSLIRPAVWLAAFAAMAVPCLADDDAFVEVDPTTVLGPGEMLFQQWLGWTHGHSGEGFNGFQAVTEFDYGVSDRLQVSLNLEYDWQRVRAPGLPAETSDAPALSAEAIYVLIPARNGRFGLSLAFDPSISRDARGLGLRLLMQKNVFGFENALNIGVQSVWNRVPGGWTEDSALTLNYGIAFPLDEHWTVSLEANNERGFNGLFPSWNTAQSSDTYFAGPTFQYDCELAVFTLGVQAQLPMADADADQAGFTPDAERFRVILRVTKAL